MSQARRESKRKTDPPDGASVETLTMQLDEIKVQIAARAAEVNGDDLLEKFEAQLAAKEALERVALRKLVRKWALAILGVIGVPASGFGVAAYTAAPVVQPVDVQDTVEEKTVELETAIEQNAHGVEEANRKIRVLGKEALRARDEHTDSTQLLSDKLDAISPKAKQISPEKQPGKYPHVRKAKARAASKEFEGRVDDLFGPEPEK